MAEEKNFAKFIWFNKPHEKAPDWVIGKVVIKKEEFITYLMGLDSQGGYVKFDVKEGKESKKPYLEIDDYVKPADTSNLKSPSTAVNEMLKDDDLPF